MVIVVFLVTHYTLSIFAQTFFLHRYASHKMFTMSKGWEKLFHVLCYASQGSSFLVPRAYAILHRMHHAYSDTPKDPHSPRQSKGFFDMMWKTAVTYEGFAERSVEPEARFLGDIPEIPWLDRFGHTWGSRVAWGAAYAVFYIEFATHWWQYLLLPLHWFFGPIQGAIVNWGGHRYGYRNFDEINDDSRNTLPVDFVTMGELFQNNHHKYAMSPNFAVRRWELDPTYHLVIRPLALLGIIKMRDHEQKMQWPAPA